MTQDIPEIFDTGAVATNRQRAGNAFSSHDFLYREVASRLRDRKADVKRNFETAATVSAWDGNGGVPETVGLPPGSVDLIESNFALHWVNDLPGLLMQIRLALKPDGLFLAAFPGGDTLTELRQSLIEAESLVTGGIAPRVSPFIDLADAAALLQRAGFALPVADLDRITVTYEDAFGLMRELRGMGEANALCGRPRHFSRREIFFEAARIYAGKFADADGRLRATFDIVFMTGWAPHASQPQPLKPGSGETSLADILKTKD